MNKLNFISKKNGEVLDSREWNLLVSFINTLIDFYNEFPETVSSFDNDSGYLTLKDIAEYATKGDVASAIQTLINSGGITGPQGEPGLVPYIDNVTKHWMIGDVDTGIISEGKNGANGITPHIDSTTKHWMIGNIDTGIVAEGQNGTNGIDGTNGTDGITPHIDPVSKHWMIGSTDTGIVAEGLNGTNGQDGTNGTNGTNGTDGITPHIDPTTGNWFIGNTDTGVHAQGPAGQDGTAAGQLQADWNQSDNTQPDYVKNKPLVYTKSEADNKFVANHDYVEIGGVKWATMNLGANSVTDVGLYFLWGDIQGYTASQVGSGEGQKYFSWEDYKYGNGTSDPGDDITKYNKIDGERFLNACDDAARLVTGGKWRMPTLDEILALANNSTITSVSNYNGTGVSGALFTSTTNPSATLFFPFSGYGARSGSGISTSSHTFSFWSNEKPLGSTLVPKAHVLYCHDGLHIDSEGNVAYGLYVDSYYNDSDRYIGKVIRPVLDDVNAEVAYTGDYNDLSNIPDVYTKNESDLQFVKNEYVKIGNYIWSTKNLGASYKTDIGLTFLWGNLVPEIATNAFNDFRGDINNNRFYDSGQQTYIKYNDSIGYLTTDIEDEDDAVINIMGGSWIMPKERHIQDLFQNSTQQYIENYENSGVKGFLFTDSSDSTKQLFFPVLDRGSHTYAYWVGSILNTPDEDTTARTIWFYMGSSDVNDYRPISNIGEWRNTVLPIRPVLNNSYQKTIKESLDLTSDLGKIFAFKSELSNCVQTSNTSGLLKNDGTVDTNSYSKVWSGTQALYDALSSYDSNTIYIIT